MLALVMVTIHFQTTLYSLDKRDKVRVWNIQVTESGANRVHVRKTYGILDMKQTSVQTLIKAGKNIGKSNETTLVQQGIAEAKSLIEKQKDAGYVEDRDNLRRSADVFLPMLASDYNKMGKKMKFPCYCQPKLDGVRMVLGKMHGKIVMKTRTGKDVKFLDHIKDEVEVFIPEGVFLDGEVFSQDKTFEEISGNFRKEQASDADMKFYVFDSFDINSISLTFEQRIQWLHEFFLLHKFVHSIQVETKEMETAEGVDSAHNAYVESGHEGIILRASGGVYELNTRSKNLQKYKKFFTDEFKIVGVQAGKGRDEDTGIFIVEIEPGKIFRCRPKGTLEYRKEIWSHRSDYIGKMLTVQYQEKTAEGSIRFPIGIATRDYES